MLHKFSLMTGASQSEFQEKWTGLENLLFKYAALQDRQAIKKLLTHYGSTESKCAGRVAYYFVIVMHCALGLLDRRTSYAIQLLSICLGRGKGQALLTIFEVCICMCITCIS